MTFAESSDFPRTNTGKRILSPDEARLREEFAKAVLPVCYEEAIEAFKRAGFPDEQWRLGVALDAYHMADAMLVARNIER